MDVLPIVKRNLIVFPLVCIAAVALMFLSEGSYWQSIDKLNNLRAIDATRASIYSLTRNLLEAESGQRSYLLTGNKAYLKPYGEALAEIDEAFRILDVHPSEEPAFTALRTQLHTLTKAKLAEWAMTIRQYGDGQVDTSAPARWGDTGGAQTGDIRAISAISARMLEDATLHLAAVGQDVRRTLMVSRIGMAALCAISLLALFLHLRHSFALSQHQQEQQRRVQAEHDRLEVEVIQRTAQLTELTRHLLTAREDERNRLARNLHDELGSLLTSAKLDAARIKSRLAGTQPEALERLANLVGTLNNSIALGRRIIEDLRPSTLSNLGLVATLEILAREFGAEAGIDVHCDLSPVHLTAACELMVYRLVQEALTNIAKHAKARHVWIGLVAQQGQIQVSVRDDGVGFDATMKPKSAYGLLGMRFRVEAEGGVLSVVSAPGNGTLIQAILQESMPKTSTAILPVASALV